MWSLTLTAMDMEEYFPCKRATLFKKLVIVYRPFYFPARGLN